MPDNNLDLGVTKQEHLMEQPSKEKSKPQEQFLTKEQTANKTPLNDPSYGANNKLVSRERAVELRKILREKLSQLNTKKEKIVSDVLVSFPAEFDQEVYAKAKPRFIVVYNDFLDTGKSLQEFVAFIKENFGEGTKPYLKQFVKDKNDVGKLLVSTVDPAEVNGNASFPNDGEKCSIEIDANSIPMLH